MVVQDGSLARVRHERMIAGRGAWLPLGALAEGRRGLWSVYVVRDTASEGEAAGSASSARSVVERRQVDVVHSDGELKCSDMVDQLFEPIDE